MSTMTAQVTLLENVRWEGKAGSGHSLLIDGPLEAGGENAGFRPMELMLLGLGSCIAYDTLMILRRMRQRVTSYQVSLIGERAEDPPAVYTTVTLEHVIAGRNVSEDSVQRALALAEDKYCAAWAMFSKTARLFNSCRIEAS
jgi:putative redox protein